VTTGVHKTFRFKLPAVRRTDRRRGLHDGRGPPTSAGHSDLSSHGGSSLDETVPLQPFSPFVDRLRPPAARSRHNHDAAADLGPGLTETGRVQAWRCSQGSLRKQSSVEDVAAGEPTGNGWRLSPAPPPLSARHDISTTSFSLFL